MGVTDNSDFSQYYHAKKETLYYYALKILGNSEDALDVVQETCNLCCRYSQSSSHTAELRIA